MRFTPQATIASATPDAGEVLVTGVDGDGTPINVLLRNVSEIKAELQQHEADAATMAAAVENEIATHAEKLRTHHARAVRAQRQSIDQKAFDLAIKQVATVED